MARASAPVRNFPPEWTVGFGKDMYMTDRGEIVALGFQCRVSNCKNIENIQKEIILLDLKAE